MVADAVTGTTDVTGGGVTAPQSVLQLRFVPAVSADNSGCPPTLPGICHISRPQT
jgi:hypothetical protein